MIISLWYPVPALEDIFSYIKVSVRIDSIKYHSLSSKNVLMILGAFMFMRKNYKLSNFFIDIASLYILQIGL